AIHRYRGTLSAGPNFAYELCLRRISDRDLEGLDLSSWRIAFNGAEAVSPVTIERFSRRFAACGLRASAMTPVYGLAECSVGLAFPPMGRGPLIDHIDREALMVSGRAVAVPEADAEARRVVACGLPLPGHQIRIVDAAGRELPERHEGGLQFRGPSATSGYFRNAAESRRLFHGDWLESGDLAYIAGGDVYITGRTKDIIIRAGRNVYPAELEEAVGGIPGIRKGNVAVFGSTDPDSGRERLVVLAESRQKDPAALNAMRTQVNALAVDLTGVAPDDVVLVPPNTVLKTSSGKIRRAATREVYERGLIGKPRRAVWWQITRLALSGAVPQLRRTGRAVSWALYAAYAWGLTGLLVPILWVSVAVLPRVSWCWALSRRAVRLLARASGTPLMVQGLENLPPPDRACVFVSNHTGYLDGFVLIATLPRLFGFVAKAELTGSVITRVFLRRLQAEFVERFDKAKGADDARRMAHVVRSGRSLLFFPEGTFVRMPGLMPFQMGAFVAAAEAGVPVVPVAIRGTRSILRPDSWFPRRGAITVTVGLPIEPDALSAGTPAADTWSVALRLRDATRREILRHCAEPDLEHERFPVLEASET
ncbi:MAG: AMP-binding protein, partial [Alphaproteobacteria bacterium]|nr:AMP-binding protein [Alphaproteobacteria bacterium]